MAEIRKHFEQSLQMQVRSARSETKWSSEDGSPNIRYADQGLSMFCQPEVFNVNGSTMPKDVNFEVNHI